MKKRKRRYSTKNILFIYSAMILIVAVISFAVSMYFSGNIKAARHAGDVKDSQAGQDTDVALDKYYVMITSDRDLDFWKSVYEGAREEGLKKGVSVEMIGDNLSESYSEIELMEIAIASKVDGIIVYADESLEMRTLIDEAVGKGIPVVTVYGDNANSSRICYVGVGSYNLGREYGKQIVKIARETELSNTTASTHMNDVIRVVALINSYSDNANQSLVWSGIQSTVVSENNTQIQIELTQAYVDNRNTFTTEESIRDIFRSEEAPDVIICLNETDTNCVYQSLVDYNKVGKASILGYYDSESILKGISRNVIYSTISVDTHQMGVYCVDAIKEYEETGNISQYMPADITLIDKNNVSDYLNETEEVTE